MASSTNKPKKAAKKPPKRQNTTHGELMRVKPIYDAVQDALDESKDNHIAETLLMRKLPLPK